MNAVRAGGIGAVITAIGWYGWKMIKPLITPDIIITALIIASIGMGILLAGWSVSWIATQMYKITHPSPKDDTLRDIWRIKLYYVAWITALPGAIAVEVVALLMHLDERTAIVFGVLGTVWVFLVVGSSPFAWRFIFLFFIPFTLRKFVRIDRNNQGEIESYRDLTDPEAKTQYFKPPEEKK